MFENNPINETNDISCFLFDFGNVIGFFDRTITYERIVKLSGKTINQSQVEAAVHAGGLFTAFEKGEISSEHFVGTILQRLGIHTSFEVIKEAWSDILTPNMDVIQLLPQLSEASYRLVLGSNNNPMHFEQIGKQFGGWLKPFDRMILSHEVGVMKPEQEFFSLCIEACDCKPKSIVFIDDLEENISNAAKMGFITLLYNRGVNLEVELSTMGILVDGFPVQNHNSS